MSLKDFKERQALVDRSREERERNHQVRVSAQHFLRHHVPIVAAHLRSGMRMSEALSCDDLRDDVHAARAAAVRLQAMLTGQDPALVPLNDARHLRSETVRLVASRRERGLATDPDELVAALAGVVGMAERSDRAKDIDWGAMTDDGSMSLTSLAASLGLFNATDVYDFRIGRAEALRRLTGEAVGLAARGVDSLAAPGMSAEDRRSLFQSLLRDVTTLLRIRYETKARETIESVLALRVDMRDAWFSDHDPFSDLLAEFREDAEAFLEHAARALSLVVGGDHQPPAPRPEA